MPVNITVDNFAVAALAEASGGGTFTRNGNNYTLDLGTLAQGSGPVSIDLNALNTATGPADALAGSFQLSGPSVFAATGFGGFSGLGAGASIGIGTITLDTGTAGTFQETLTFDPTGSNASGYMAALAPETLTVTAVVASTGPQLTGQIVLASATEGLALGTGTLVANFSDSDVSDAAGDIQCHHRLGRRHNQPRHGLGCERQLHGLRRPRLRRGGCQGAERDHH